MPPPGGAATINGILYQVLRSLHWAATLRISGTPTSAGDIDSAALVLEPAGGGGDLRIVWPSQAIVEQIKARTGGTTWPLQTIIEEVLPDLYLAVDESKLAAPIVYRFVTEGRVGDWARAKQFFEGLNHIVPAIPLRELGADERERFARGLVCTEKGLFLKIVRDLRRVRKSSIGSEPVAMVRQKLWHLLSRFDFVGGEAAEKTEDEIDHLLLAVVTDQNAVASTRDQLCGLIMRLAREGNVSISPKDLLAQAGLNAVPLTELARIRALTQQELNQTFRRLRYRTSDDVRKPPDWPRTKQFLVLASESGQGKTWRLASIAVQATAQPGQLAAFVTASASGTAVNDIRRASEIIWERVLNHPSPGALAQLPERIRTLSPKCPAPSVTVLVDDVQDTGRADELLELVWGQKDVRLAMAAPLSVGLAMAKNYPDDVQLFEFGDFTVEELERELSSVGLDRAGLPWDVQQTLQRPLLAGLFLELAGTAGWLPIHEYELYEGMWSRITSRRVHGLHPNDPSLLASLAAGLLREGARYPWSQVSLRAAGIDDGCQQRLETSGWLTTSGTTDQVSIWHDRLLNWAVAEGLAQQLRSGEITVDSLAEVLNNLVYETPLKAGRNLGYVPMDALWIVASPTDVVSSFAAPLLAAIERPKEFHSTSSAVYERLVPTLGGRGVQVIASRLTGAGGDPPEAALAATALFKIARKTPGPVESILDTLLSSTVTEARETALRLLARRPTRGHLDRLWQLHQQARTALADTNDLFRGHRYEITLGALRSCAAHEYGWIIKAVAAYSGGELPVLSDLIAGLPQLEGQRVWVATREKLFREIPPDKTFGLINCVRRFHDRERIGWLERQVREGNEWVTGAALAALAEIDPDTAVAKLADVADQGLVLSKGWWFPPLLSSRRKQIQEAILARLRARQGSPWHLATVYAGYEDAVDRETAKFLLDSLEGLLEQFRANPPDRSGVLCGPLHVVTRISNNEALAELAARRGSNFEASLATIAIAWLGRSGRSFDHELEMIRTLLVRIAGEGITNLVNTELAHPLPFVRLDGVRWALVRENKMTVSHLRVLALPEEFLDADSHGWLVMTEALMNLAELGENETIVRALLRWGTKVQRVELAETRLSLPPMEPRFLDDARRILSDSAATEDARAGAASAVGLSGRTEDAPLLEFALQGAPTGGPLAIAVIIALGLLRDDSSKAIGLLEDHASRPSTCFAAKQALFRIGTRAALDALENVEAAAPDSDQLFLYELWQRHHRRSTATLAWRAIRATQVGPEPPELLAALGDVQEPKALDVLEKYAFQFTLTGEVSRAVIAAIRGLARHRPELASSIAEEALTGDYRHQEMIPLLLAELWPDEAITILSEAAVAEEQAVTWFAIAVALRELSGGGRAAAVHSKLGDMLEDADALRRATAGELLGFQGPDVLRQELQRVSTEDPDPKPRRKARNALAAQDREGEAVRLAARVANAEHTEQWAIADAILQLVNPLVFDAMHDPTPITDALRALTPALQRMIRSRLQDLSKDAKAKAKRDP